MIIRPIASNDVNVPDVPPFTGQLIGADIGQRSFTTSDGAPVNRPSLFKSLQSSIESAKRSTRKTEAIKELREIRCN